MAEAFLWGFIGASSLVVGALQATYLSISKRLLGLIMAFGVGVLISAISFELTQTAFESTKNGFIVVFGLFVGAVVFSAGDFLISRHGGRSHKKAGQSADQNSGLVILLGTVLDGVPESIVIGLGLISGGSVSVAMIVAVFLSNLPEAIGSTKGLLSSGWKSSRILVLWFVVAVVSGISALLGYAIFDSVGPTVYAFTLSFAGGALLSMIADSMMPEAYNDSGKFAGLITTIGFGVAYLVSIIS